MYQFVQDHRQDDPALLLLRRHDIADFDIRDAVQQIAARQKAATKLPEWTSNPRVLFPSSISLEQSSSELTARFKAGMVQGKTLVDLTGGLGVDTFYMGRHFDQVLYLERQENLVQLAVHNFALLNTSKTKYECLTADSISFLEQASEVFDCLYVDPARRGENNKKLYKLADCEPDIRAAWELLKSRGNQILVKASPMLDIKAVLSEIPDIQRVMVVAVKNEVKEVLLMWHRTKCEEELKIIAYNLGGRGGVPFEFTYHEEENVSIDCDLPREYVIAPNAAIMKSGGFRSFACMFGLRKLHNNTHLYTTATLPGEIPGRVFRIIEEVKLDKKTVKRCFPSGKVNVIVRNHPLKPEALKKKYGLKDGGEDYLLAFRTMDDQPRMYWCKRV